MKVSSRLQQARLLRLLIVVGMLVAFLPQLAATRTSAATLPAQLQQPNVATPDLTQQTTLTHNGALVAPLDATQSLNLVVSLKEKDSAGLTQFLSDVQNPTSSSYHQFLTPAEYGARFAPDASARQQVASYLQAQGFSITNNNQNSSSISFKGTVGQAQNAFQVKLATYQRADGSTFFANDRTPALPSSFAANVIDVFGLSSEVQAHNNLKIKTDSTGKVEPHRGPQGSGYTPAELRKAYDIPDSYTGAGQTIGLYELGGYDPHNIDIYDQAFNLPTGNRVDVRVDQPGTTCAQPDGNNGGAEAEVELDIEIANAIAPQAKVVVYCGGPYGGNTFASGLDVYQAMATDTANSPAVMSESYGFGNELLNFGFQSFLEAESNYLRQIAAQGTSFFASSGDSGANDGAGNPQVPSDPATQPYLTAVGGTHLVVNGSGTNSSYGQETVWNSGIGSGGGGGISNYFSKNTAPWQQGPGVNNAYSAANPGRQYPDVTANADPTSGYAVFTTDSQYGVNWFTYGGTSASSPLWAALATDAAAVKGGKLGLLNPALYSILQNNTKYRTDFHDITGGNNDTACVPGRPCQDITQGGPFYPATPGYDIASGIGSPDAAKLVPDLLSVAPGPYLSAPVSAKVSTDVSAAGSQVISLTTYGNAVATTYTATVSAVTPGVALAVTPATGTVNAGSVVPVTLTATPNAGAAVGVYTATVTFSGSAGGLALPVATTTVYINVGGLRVSGTTGSGLAGNNLVFQQPDTSTTPITKTIVLTTTATTPQTYLLSVQDGLGFVTVNGLLYDAAYTNTVPSFTVSAGNPVTVTVGVNPNGPASFAGGSPLAPNKYQAQLAFFKATDFLNVPPSADEQDFNLVYNVSGQVLNASPLTVNFGATAGGSSNPPNQVVSVSDSGFLAANASVPVSITYNLNGLPKVSTNASWLRVGAPGANAPIVDSLGNVTITSTVPATGNLPITLAALSTGLAPGIYQAVINIQSSNSNSVALIYVTLRVNAVPELSVNVSGLIFNVPISSTVPVTQTFTVAAATPNSASGFNITQSADPAQWLSFTPITGTVTSTVTTSFPATVTVVVDPTKFYTNTTPIKVGDAYNARINVYNTTTPDSNPNSLQGIRIPVIVNITAGNNYVLPFISNGAFNTTTYVTAQNLSNSLTGTATVQYYDTTGLATTQTTITLPPNGQAVLQTSALASGSSGSATVNSNVPLNLLVTEAATGGSALTSSAYNVSPSTGSVLYNPIALNGDFGGYTTNTFVYNAGTITASGVISYYAETGAVVTATDSFTLAPHTGTNLAQSNPALGLQNNLSYFSVISSTTANSSLVAQVTESGPNNFLAVFEATPRLGQTLFAPTAYSAAFGATNNFNTGFSIVNPNPQAATVTINYYDANSGTISATQTLNIPANGVGLSYTPSSGVPSGFVGSAIISSTQRVAATINERGTPGSGTYVALPNASTRVGLPAVANGFANFTTGTTLLNVTGQAIQVTLQYYNASGTPLTPALTYSVQPYASVLAYQGGNGQAALPAGFFGTAVLTSNTPNSLVATTNANAPGLFYTYTEPAQ